MLVYNTQVAYNCEKNESNPEEYIYTGVFYYAEDSTPMYGNQFKIFAKDHKEFIKEVEAVIYKFFCIADEFPNGEEEYRIFINDYCIRHRS